MKIGLLGLGTVGSGVYHILETYRTSLSKVYGEPLEITRILDHDPNKKAQYPKLEHLLTADPQSILEDTDIDLVVEVIGGLDDAHTFISQALSQGKHVVTANKVVVARHLQELSTLATRQQCAFLYEASVGGGIPLLKPLQQYATLNDFYEVKGILNGTSNYILTQMFEERCGFDKALKDAQALGYAESDPSDDVQGADVARKMAILATLAFKQYVPLTDVVYRGIEHITQADVEVLADLGYVVKLLGKAVVVKPYFSVLVEPVIFKQDTQFAQVQNAYNLVSVKGNHVDEVQFYGQGAGKLPTANAVVSNILDVVSNRYSGCLAQRSDRLESLGGGLIKEPYVLRISPQTSLEKKASLQLLSDMNIQYTLLSKHSDPIVMTEILCARHMAELSQLLTHAGISHFYARLEDG